MCILGYTLILLSIYGSYRPKTPNFGAWIGIFLPNVQNIQIFILQKLLNGFQPKDDKDLQVLMGGPKMCHINPRWRTAAILKNRKISISPQSFGQFVEIWRGNTFGTYAPVWALKIYYFESNMADVFVNTLNCCGALFNGVQGYFTGLLPIPQ